MDIIERVKNICLTPGTEWPVIAGETTPTATLITGYVVPLAAIGAVAGLIGGTVFGYSLPFIGAYHRSITSELSTAVIGLAFGIVGIFVVSLIINALAPTFGGEQNSAQALKVAVYSYTPAWVAGVLRIVPSLGVLAILAGLYALYLLYLGLPRLMKCPEDKAVGYTAVVVVCAIVIFAVLGTVGGLIGGAGLMGRTAFDGSFDRSRADAPVQFDKNSPMGKLQELSKSLEESNKKVDAAQKAGDTKGQVNAAMQGLGTLLGGGARVDPLGIEQLKPFAPETFAGLSKRTSNAEKSGVAGLMVSKAEATYGDGAGKTVTLEISDTGGMSGLVGLASWAGVQGEKEDENGAERTATVDGRLVHERRSKRGGQDEYGVVLGERFVVSAKGTGVGVTELKAAVSGLELGKLESMKDVGRQK